MSSQPPTEAFQEARPIRWMQAIIAVSALCSLSAIVWGRGLNYDEVEFFRASDWIRRGLVPYRDFWEHHSPLAWYAFAPFTHFGSGITPLVLVRLLQIPMWIAALCAVHRWNVRAGLTRWASWASLALLVTSYVFSLKAIEYRVDTPASLFLLLGVVMIMFSDRRPLLCLGGAFMVLATLANVRLLPLAAAATFLGAVFRDRRWNVKPLVWPVIGGAATGVLYVAYLLVTRSAVSAWRELIVQNALGDQFPVQPLSGRAAVFGRVIGILWDPRGIRFSSADIDLACTALFLLGVAGLAIALRRPLPPGPLQIIAALQIVNIIAVLRMKVTYLYHLEGVALLMVPLAALAIDTASRHATRLKIAHLLLAIAAAALFLQIFISIFRADHETFRTQDALIRNLNTRWRGSPVFDAVGYGYETRPAWRYWFIPLLVENLIRHGFVQPLDVNTLANTRPAVVIYTLRMGRFLSWQPELLRYVTHYYAPLTRFEWGRALNGVIDGNSSATWTTPVGGVYRIYASPLLARHPWFRQPLGAASTVGEDADVLEVHLPEFTESRGDLDFLEDSAPVVAEKGAIRLRAGSAVQCRNRSAAAVGVVLMPSDDSVLFRRLPHEAGIEASDVLPKARVPW